MVLNGQPVIAYGLTFLSLALPSFGAAARN